MKKIIWIASYPKSGNTWMRYLLGNYFFNNSKKFDPNIIKNLKKFHINDDLVKLKDFEEAIKKNPTNISKYWIQSQEKLDVINGNVAFLKTHNALININNNEFTNSKLSLGIIYIVRDPRDVAISYSKFRNLSLDDTIDHMVSQNLVYVKNKDQFADIEIIGSWKFNYNSWKKGIPLIPRVFVKYEDLVDDCYNSFSNVINFLSKRMGFKVNSEKIKSSVKLSDFELLKNNEKENSFSENRGTRNFFLTGKYNNWQNVLNTSQVKKLEDNLFTEMKDLKYI